MKKWNFILLTALVLSGCTGNERNESSETSQITHPNQPNVTPYISMDATPLDNIQTEINQPNFTSPDQYFDSVYTAVEGVITFRGNHLRTSPSYGTVKEAHALKERYRFLTNSNPEWGGGAGWTGQASIIKWDEDVKKMMNLKEKFKEKDNFIEVVYASLDGDIYFFDLETGEKTRENISINNPIKGSLSLDPRGYPLLYVGQGIPDTGDDKIGYRIFSLIDGELLHFTPGITNFVHRWWGAFDGSALINRKTDTLVLGGENGILYQIKLNTVFDKAKKTISISPEEVQYRYQIEGNAHQGIENSVAVYKNLAYFADNGGSVQGVNLQTMKPFFALSATDDTDATIVIDEENDTPFLYTGTEIDKQGKQGNVLIRKIHGVTGDVAWEKSYPAFTVDGVNGGMLATPVVGKKTLEDLVIFTIARYKTINGGLMIALDKKTGDEVWKKEMNYYSWSSPVDIYKKDGKGYIVQADATGTIHLLDGLTGETIDTLLVGYNIEASPAVFNNMLVVASRGGFIHGIEISEK